MKSTKVLNPRHKCSAVVETNCPVAEYRIPYRIGPCTIITHAHRAPLIDGWATQRGPRHKLVATPSQAIACCVIVSGFRAALDLDTYPLRNLIRPQCAEWAKPGRGKPFCSLCILAFSLGFTPHLLNAVVSARSPFSCPCSTEAVGIAHKPPRSL